MASSDRNDAENQSLLSSNEACISSSNGVNEPNNTRMISRGSDNAISPIVSEDEKSITIRRPLQYYSISRPEARNQHTERTQAQVHRYRYYSRLAPHRDSIMMMPNHIVPPEFFNVIPVKFDGKQHSIVTIFAIWNTMMGSSVLSMPWAVQQAGFVNALVLLVAMAGLTLYTAYRVLKSQEFVDIDNVVEFSDICGYYLGKAGEYVSIFFSLFALLGASTVYWVLISNFLFHIGSFIFEKAQFHNETPPAIYGTNFTDVYCPVPTSNSSTTEKNIFYTAWSQTNTVPFYLVIIVMPLLNFRSPTFFTKFNALGTLGVVFIISFVSVKASHWGFHVDFDTAHSTSSNFTKLFNANFPALTGILALAYFLHNCVISIMRNQQTPQKNGRDLSIAYVLVMSTYVFIGFMFYSSFPLTKSCIQDNLLNNFRSTDVLAFVARIFLFFQIITVFPLLIYIMRVQFMHPVFGDTYPSVKHVVIFNIAILAFCLLFAVFLPQIGTIIRFSGAICGLMYVFTLPCLIYMLQEKREGKLTVVKIIVHSVIPLLGLANVIGQFLISQ